MSSSPPNPRAAYCEEYNEDKHTTLPETRQTANIAVKRSRTDIARLKTADTRDERSDSGNSSQTVATLNSGDSSLESKAGTKPLRVDTKVHTLRRQPKLVAKQPENKPRSPQKSSLRRSNSKAGGERPKKPEECNCDKCKTNARKSLTPLETSFPAAINRQARPRNEATATPQPARPPSRPRAIPNTSVYQPAQARPRAPTSYPQVRPMSYHDNVLEAMYTQQSYFPGPQPPPSPFEIQARSQILQWPPEHPSRRQSMVYHSSPIVEYPLQSPYITRPLSAQPPPCPSFPYHDPSPAPRKMYISRDEDFYSMPPPPAPIPVPRQRSRPQMQHSATISTHPMLHPMLHHTNKRHVDENTEQRPGHRSPRKEQAGEHISSRRPSLTSRPSATPSSGKSSSHSIERSLARMSVDSSDAAVKHKRRASYYGHEKPHDLERVVETYQADVKTTAEALPVPITDSLVRRKTHSDTGSRASAEGRTSREGSDVKPRSSTDRRNGSDVKARNDNDDFTVRFKPSSGLNLAVKGVSGEDQTFKFRQSREGDGKVEVSVGNTERHALSRTASRNDGRERQGKRYSSVSGIGNKGLEVARSASRMRGERDTGREREKRVAGSRSRRSSRSGYSGKGLAEE